MRAVAMEEARREKEREGEERMRGVVGAGFRIH
jgi:hypothetical protein